MKLEHLNARQMCEIQVYLKALEKKNTNKPKSETIELGDIK